MAKDKELQDHMNRQLQHVQDLVGKFQTKIAEVKAAIDDPDNTNDDELTQELAGLEASLQDKLSHADRIVQKAAKGNP